MTHVLRARRLLTEEGWLDDHQLRIADGVIAAIEPIPVGVTERDAELLCPAYIDTHVHGGAGVDVMDDAPDALDKLAMHKAREGVGSWLPTTVTAPLNTIHAALKRIALRCQRGGPGAQVLGSYLEGPYFTPQNKGAHPPELFRELEINLNPAHQRGEALSDLRVHQRHKPGLPEAGTDIHQQMLSCRLNKDEYPRHKALRQCRYSGLRSQRKDPCVR